MAIQFIGDFMYSYPSYWESVLITASFKGAADKGMAARTMELMQKHYEFYGELMEENSYVTRGSILCCSAGSTRSIFDLPIDHAVERSDGAAVGICTDCKENENIISFGYCSNPTPEGYPKRSATASFAAPGGMIEKEKCIPMLEKRWQTGSGDDLRIYDQTQGIYSEALTSGAFLTCFYGGVIRVAEVNKNNEHLDEILPLESAWLKEHQREYKKYVTIENLEDLGWKDIHDYYVEKGTEKRSDWQDVFQPDGTFDPDPGIESHYRQLNEQDITNLNRVLNLYHITTYERICYFMAQITYECTYGIAMCERVGKDGDEPKDTTRTEMARWHEANHTYPYQYRGGGTIHLTGEDNYKKASEVIGDANICMGTEYLAFNYPWLCAGVYWNWRNINADIDEGIEAVTEAINGGFNGLDQRGEIYKKCKEIFKDIIVD